MHDFLLDYDAFPLGPWLVKCYRRRQLTREEGIESYRISKDSRVVENVFGILASRFRVLLGIMEQRPKIVRDIDFTCVVLYNMLRTHQGKAARAPTHRMRLQLYQMHQQNMWLMKTAGIPLASAPPGPTQGLLQSHWCFRGTGDEDLKCDKDLPLGEKKLVSIRPFQDYPIIPRTFI